MNRPWVKNMMWVLGVLAVLVSMQFVHKSQDQKIMGLPEIVLETHEDMLFLSTDDILEKLSDKGLVHDTMTYAKADIMAVEAYLSEIPEVKSVQVYSTLGDNWCIELRQRSPIARIFNIDGSSCYLDSDGTLMPFSTNYTPHVISVTGNINETDFSKSVNEIMNNDSLKTIEILDDLYELSTYVCSDEFLSAQFTQVHINKHNEFELIPRVGNHRILFGDSEHIPGKFKKLELFYSEGLSRAGWDMYDTINVMYKDQVVCSKR
jgi:cell division protein FtsQ